MKTLRSAFALLAAFTLFVAATPAQADVKVYPRDSVVFGATYDSWAAAWQQWAASIPAAEHPLLDFSNPKADCSTGQFGPVFFLGGRFCVNGDEECQDAFKEKDPIERKCTVPVGKAIFFPIVNFGCLNAEAENGYCGEGVGPYIHQMRAAIGSTIDGTEDLAVTVDGKAVKADFHKEFRVQSPVYTAVLPKDNMLLAIGEKIEAGTYWGVDDGVYLMLPPLSPGEHTLTFKGWFLDFIYHLTVK